ncbi:MAG: hypothetical protein J7L88_05550, partial [Thermoplasmata archaeon]|nr:hypothetical protein [Thermoplasmata archaeon]
MDEREMYERKLKVLERLFGGGENLEFILKEDLPLFKTEYYNYLSELLRNLADKELEEGSGVEEVERALFEVAKEMEELKEKITEEDLALFLG